MVRRTDHDTEESHTTPAHQNEREADGRESRDQCAFGRKSAAGGWHCVQEAALTEI
jgi:hypothetical protein